MMLSPRPWLATLAGSASIALTLVLVRPAHATDKTAETLYQEGRRAAGEKDWDLACRKFRESHEREPAPGTLLNLGDCEEKRGRLVAAQGHFHAAARLFHVGDERASYARQRATALDRRVPRLTLRLAPSAPLGTSIERDGAEVESGALDVPVAVDAGEHQIVVRARGRTATRMSVRLAESDVREIELAPGAPTESSRLAASPAREGQTSAHVTPPGASAAPPKTLALVSLGVGAAALGVGIFGGIKTMGADAVTRAHCDAVSCDLVGFKAQEDGRQWSTVATVGFVVGAVSAATGAALLLLSPRSTPARSQTGLAIAPVAGGSTLRYVGEF